MLVLQSKIVERKDLDLSLWDDFVRISPQRIIYAESFYLDAVFENWKAILCYHDKKLMAIMPLCVKGLSFFNAVFQPSWTKYLGILFCLMDEKKHRQYFLKKKIIESIILCFPKNLYFFNVNFSPYFEYFVPFTWHKFKVSPFQTFRLPLQGSKQELLDNFSSSIRNSLKNAQRLNLKVIENESILPTSELLLKRNIINEKEQNVLLRIWDVLSSKQKCFTIYIKDSENKHIYCGGSFIISFNEVIFLTLVLDFEYKKSGAASLLIWTAIQKAKSMDNIKYFDFEGSMIEGIENFFRGFGAQSILYYNIQKTNSAVTMLKKIKDILFKPIPIKRMS